MKTCFLGLLEEPRKAGMTSKGRTEYQVMNKMDSRRAGSRMFLLAIGRTSAITLSERKDIREF